MTHDQAEQLARDLMERHGLIERGWRFRWSRARRQLGSCQVRRCRDPRTGRMHEVRTIRLSIHLVAINSDEEVRETILHEIAHALAGVSNGHNAIWKRICRRIGARPERLAGEEVRIVEGRYVIICGRCDNELGRRHRRPSARHFARLYCRACGPPSMGKLKLMPRSTGDPNGGVSRD